MLELALRENGESLLDWMARQVSCEYLSDLRQLTEQQRKSLSAALKPLKAEESELRQWNDALTYLFHDSAAQKTAAAAREMLLRQLNNQRQQ